MNERFRDLVISAGIYDSLCDPYDKNNTGDPYGSIMDDLEKIAELIVRECCDKFVDMQHKFHPSICAYEIKKHFGVEE